MKETGILRRIDELGRIVIPKEIRKKLKIREGDNLDIYVDDNNVILRKYSPLNDLETILDILLDAVKSNYNNSIVVTDLTKIIASSKPEFIAGEELTESFIGVINQKEEMHINKNISLEIVNERRTNQNLLIKPLLNYGDLFGVIILFYEHDSISNHQEQIDLIHQFCTEYISI